MQLGRREFIATSGLAIAGSLFGRPTPAYAATWHLHEDCGPARSLYAAEPCPAAKIDCYYRQGALYVRSRTLNRIRTHAFDYLVQDCDSDWDDAPAAIPERCRWMSLREASHWIDRTGEYRFTGNLLVNGESPVEHVSSGITFHPVHHSNQNNYFVKIWAPGDRSHMRGKYGIEIDGGEYFREYFDFPFAWAPSNSVWHTYRLDYIDGTATAGPVIRFKFNGQYIFTWNTPSPQELTAAGLPADSHPRGPVGMRLDYYDVTLENTRVFMPS